jgi:predicted PurR-regulated permease PerM
MAVFNYKQRNNILLVILILLGCFILYSIRDIAGSLLSTVIMYVIFRPVFFYLTEKQKLSRVLASILIIIGSFIIIIGPFLALSLLVISKIKEFQEDPIKIKVLVKKLDDFAGEKLSQPNLIDQTLGKASNYISDLFPSILTGAAHILLGVAIMYFLLYFMFTCHEEFEKGLLKYAPFREQNAMKFSTELKHITYANVLGQGLIAVVQGGLVSIGFFIFNIPDAIFWGVIATFLSFLPVVGAPIIFVPAALIEIVNGHSGAGWGLLAFGLLLITNIDNIIRYLLAKRIGNIHPIITIIGVIIGIPVFGIMGLVYGPLLLSYFILTVNIYETSRLATERLERIKSAEEE